MKKSRNLRLVRTLIASLLMALMVVSLSAPEAMAKSKTKTMTAYDQVIVNGGYAYCAAYDGLYKVNLKTESKKLLVPAADPEARTTVGEMKIYKGYLYYTNGGVVSPKLYRIKLSGKNKKFLGNIVNYAISNGRIYYTTRSKSGKILKKSMKLDGTNKKKSSYKVKMTYKNSNKSGYHIDQVLTQSDPHYDEITGLYDYTEYYTECLITPSEEEIAIDSYVIPYDAM